MDSLNHEAKRDKASQYADFVLFSGSNSAWGLRRIIDQ